MSSSTTDNDEARPYPDFVQAENWGETHAVYYGNVTTECGLPLIEAHGLKRVPPPAVSGRPCLECEVVVRAKQDAAQ